MYVCMRNSDGCVRRRREEGEEGRVLLLAVRASPTSPVFATDRTRLLMSRNSFNGDKLSRSHNTSAVVAAIRKKSSSEWRGNFPPGTVQLFLRYIFVASPQRTDWSTTTKNCALLLFESPSCRAFFPSGGRAGGGLKSAPSVPPRPAFTSRPIPTPWWIDRVQTSSPCLNSVRTSRHKPVIVLKVSLETNSHLFIQLTVSDVLFRYYHL